MPWSINRAGNVHIQICFYFFECCHTVFIQDERFIDDVVVIDVKVQVVVVHLEMDSVNHWNELEIIGWWTRCPVSTQVSKHVDMVSEEVQSWLAKYNSDIPCSLSVPCKWSW